MKPSHFITHCLRVHYMCALVYTGAKHVFEVLGVCALQDLLEAGNSSHPKNLDEKVFNEKKKKKQISAHTHTQAVH